MSPSDTPAPLVHLTDSLAREHFGGIDYIRQQEPSTLDLLIRDPHRCEDASYDPSRYAREVAQRSLVLYRPAPLQPHTPISVVRLALTRTHRLGPLVWTTTIGRYEFGAPALRTLPMPPPMACGRLPAILTPEH